MNSKIRNLMSNKYDEFASSKSYQKLKNIQIIRALKISTAKALWKLFPHHYRLHDDPILQKAFCLAVQAIGATSIVETGTFMGYSTSFMAEKFPHIPIHTCEINKRNFIISRNNLKKYKNVTVHLGESPKILERLIKSKSLGDRPLFFLDAHWLDNWPLEDEMRIITNSLSKAIIMIDDFKVPDRPEFIYDKYGKKECSIELIGPHMFKKNSYKILLPDYGRDIFKNGNYHPVLSGYPIIFQNYEKEYAKFSKESFVKKFFKDKTPLLLSRIKK